MMMADCRMSAWWIFLIETGSGGQNKLLSKDAKKLLIRQKRGDRNAF
jgi:hypothetical protein